VELVEAVSALKAHKYLVALVVLVAIVAAGIVKMGSKSIATGTATAQILVDSTRSALANLQQDTGPLAARASVFAQLMTSGVVLESIAHSAGLPPSQVTAEGPYSGSGQVLDVPTPSEARGSQVVATKLKYHLSFVAQQTLPVITASVTGPNADVAGRLANAITPGVQSWLDTLEKTSGTKLRQRVTVRQLGDAQAGTVNSSSGIALAAVAALGILIVGLLGVSLFDLRRRESADDTSGWSAADWEEYADLQVPALTGDDPGPHVPRTAVGETSAGPGGEFATALRSARNEGDVVEPLPHPYVDTSASQALRRPARSR
jgi:capsular polysaccharide biosynthesis protein